MLNTNHNFLTNLTPNSLGSLRNTYPVIAENSVTMSIETPFIPESVTLQVIQEGSNQEVFTNQLVNIVTNEEYGLILLYHNIFPNETCTPGEYLYNFDLTSETQTITRQARLRVFPRLPVKSIQLLTTLRALLSDDPLTKRTQVWSDLELLEYLELAMMEVNGTPTLTSFCLDSSPPNWGYMLVIGAEYHALRALYNRESRDVFSFNDDGLSVDISVRSEKYMNMINHLSGTYTKSKDDLKRHFRPRGMAYNSSYTDLSIRNLRPFLIASNLGNF